MPRNTDGAALVHDRWEIRPDDGPPIRGDLRYRADAVPRTAVVVCHGFKGFKDWGFFPGLAEAIARRGHAAVTFNFSRSGVGDDGVDFSALDRFAENTHSRNVEEIGKVLEAVIDRTLLPAPPLRVGLFGHSRGGGEAILAAERAPVDALVTWAAIASVDRWTPEQVAAWRRGETVHVPNARTGQQMPMGPAFGEDLERNRARLDIMGAAAAMRPPWLIVHGEADESVAVDDAHRLHRVAPATTELVLIADAGHTFGATHPPADADAPHLRMATEATVRWFDAHLAGREPGSGTT